MATSAINPLTFLKQVRTEMTKVVWPTRAQTIKLTVLVIGVSVAVSLIIAGLDVFFVKVTELLLQR